MCSSENVFQVMLTYSTTWQQLVGVEKQLYSFTCGRCLLDNYRWTPHTHFFISPVFIFVFPAIVEALQLCKDQDEVWHSV